MKTAASAARSTQSRLVREDQRPHAVSWRDRRPVDPDLQVSLLRVLQERGVVRLGSRTIIPINVRVLAAANVQLKKTSGG